MERSRLHKSLLGIRYCFGTTDGQYPSLLEDEFNDFVSFINSVCLDAEKKAYLEGFASGRNPQTEEEILGVKMDSEASWNCYHKPVYDIGKL